jgi:hypothetical protein
MKKRFISVAMIIVFLLPGLAFAGLEPTPFTPEINKLGAIENSLNSIDERIRAVLAIPPDDIIPAPVKKMDAMSYQLLLLNGFMESTMDEIINAVLSTPPDDIMPVIEALERIGLVMRNESPEGGIADVVEAYLIEYFPTNGSIAPMFYNALMQFSGNANLIILNVNAYIDQINSGLPGCSSYVTPETCNNALGCGWISGVCVVVILP